MKIYKVIGTTECENEWDTDCYGYPTMKALGHFSTREKAKDFINSYECNKIDTLFKGSFKAKEIGKGDDWRQFISDDEYYDWYIYTIDIEEIEIE